jgi:microcystin-dependent protein
MAEPFLAEIRMVGFNFAPRGWALSDGQILPINQNQSLYSLLGTTYGGDGRTSFALPELRGRTPMHPGQASGSSVDVTLGMRDGDEAVTLTDTQMPAHVHTMRASSSNADIATPDNTTLGAFTNGYTTIASNPLVELNGDKVSDVGGGQAHNNMQPYQAINFCIALQGLFPLRS